MDGHLLRFNKTVNYALIDLETYNLCLNFIQNRPWQVGVLDVVGEEVKAAHDIWVTWKDIPYLKVSAGAAEATRYNPEEHKRKGIDPDEAFYKFWPILKKADYIIMHNGLRFDAPLLKEWAIRMGEDWKFIIEKMIDTKAVAQGIKMNIPFNPQKESFADYQWKMSNSSVKGVKTKLGILGQELGIEHNYAELHNAIVDLELNLKVWSKLKYKIEL